MASLTLESVAPSTARDCVVPFTVNEMLVVFSPFNCTEDESNPVETDLCSFARD